MRFLFHAALVALAIVLAPPVWSGERDRQCLVVGVADGDTLTVRCAAPRAFRQVKVRLAGVDAPERGQAYGTRTRQALSRMAFGRMARLVCQEVDRYGRSVCTVWVAPASAPDGPQTLDAGLAMVTLGMAWWYRSYARDQTPQQRGQFAFAEEEARARRVGLWRDAAPIPPWKWRHQRE